MAEQRIDNQRDETESDREAEREFAYRAEEVVKKQRFSRRPKKTANLLSNIIARRGFAETKRNDQLEEIWIEVVGRDLARHTKLGSIRKGVLQVFVNSSAAKQHLSINKADLVEDLKLKFKGIDDLRFKVGN